MEEKRYFVDYYEHNSYFCILGPFSSLIETPFTRARFILQTQQELINKGDLLPENKYTGLLNIFRRTIKDNGVFTLWRGLFSNLFCNSIHFAFFFGIYNQLPRYEVKNTISYYHGNISNGVFASSIALLLSIPFDYYRTKVSLNFEKTIKINGEGSFLDISRKISLIGMGKGYFSSILCTTLYRGVYIGLYDSIFELYRLDQQNQALSLFLAYSTINVANLFAYPIDTIRRRMFITNGTERKYPTAMNAAYEILSKEGLYSFYRGYSVKLYNSILPSILLYSFFRFNR